MSSCAASHASKFSRAMRWRGASEATEADIERQCRELDAVDEGAGEDWQRERDQRLGRGMRPVG